MSINNILDRFTRWGRKGVSDIELLEILLRHKSGRGGVREIIGDLLKSFASFKQILDQPYDVLEVIAGKDAALIITLAKAIMVQYLEPSTDGKTIMSTPEAVADYLKAELGGFDTEHFMVLCLNSNNALIHKEVLFTGTIDQAQVYPREILKLALRKNASAVILCHNHPSGRTTPSDDDRILTKRLENIAGEVGLRVHDHLISTRESVYSLKANRIVSDK